MLKDVEIERRTVIIPQIAKIKGIFWLSTSAKIPLRPIDIGVNPNVRVMNNPKILPLISPGIAVCRMVIILILKNPSKTPNIIIKMSACNALLKILKTGKQEDTSISIRINTVLRAFCGIFMIPAVILPVMDSPMITKNKFLTMIRWS